MLDHIDIRELENIGNDPRVYLATTIHLKLNGYAPKYSIEYLKNINTGEKQKASHSKNDLLNGGGEGGICEYTRFETIKYIIDIGDLSCFSVSIT